MLLADAIDIVRQQFFPVTETETVALGHAVGRILANDLVATIDLPRRNCSAVDGFALRFADLSEGQIVTLRLIGRAAAGHPYVGTVGKGQAVRILTGAELPDGADFVVMQEYCSASDTTVAVGAERPNKANWRKRGEDIVAGEVVLGAGRRLHTPDLAIAAALGNRSVTVFRRLKVALFSTGDEVREPGEELSGGQIWDANRSLLAGLLTRMGCEVCDLGILRDEPHHLEGTLSKAAHCHDLIVTSGGMSVGAEDYIRTIIGRRGTIDVWPLAIKPGKPIGLGDIDDCPVLAMPGNPVAAFIAFAAFGRHVVDRLAHASAEEPPSLALAAGVPLAKKKGLRQFIPAMIAGSSSGSRVVPIERHSPAILSAMTVMSGLVVLPEDVEFVAAGDIVQFMPTSAMLA